MHYLLTILSLGLINCNVFAGTPLIQNSSASVLRANSTESEFKNQSSSPATFVTLPSLNSIDTDADDINKLNRKLQIEKAQAELKKIKGGGNATNNINTHVHNESAQTTVTGVAINQDSKRIAWLQFADGGSLTVNIGSKVGKYTFSDISMTGVTLSETSTGKTINRKPAGPAS